MIDTQTRAPEFTLPGTDPSVGPEEVEAYSLREYTDRGAVVLTFYLFDFNPHCSEHMCSLRELVWFDLIPETSVLAVSTDSVFSHRAFADRYNLEFPLLSDSDGRVSEAYDVLYDEFRHHRRVARRAVFVVDQSRTVQYAWTADDPRTTPDWEAVLRTFETTPTLPSLPGNRPTA